LKEKKGIVPHFYKCPTFGKMSRPVRNINWCSKHKLNSNKKLEGPMKLFKSSCF